MGRAWRMTQEVRQQDIRQWLAEIKALQQKLAQANQERDEAYASAANWRSLYETEAKQRRTEAVLSRQTIDSLKAELQVSQANAFPEAGWGESVAIAPSAIQQEIAQISDIHALQAQHFAALQERDRLFQALKTEQLAHIDTRKQLTTALGDAIDQLNQERSVSQQAH
jgi:hypothetical protein